MALLYTYSMLLDKLNNDCDLIQEPSVSTNELLGYMNEAIEDAETAVHTLCFEDTYFLSTDFIYLTPGQSQYNLPADIYANKLRKLFYSSPMTSVVTTAVTVSGNTSIVVTSATGLSQGMAVFGTGIPTTTKIVSVVGTTVVLSRAPTASGNPSLTFASSTPVYGARQYEVLKIRSLMDTMSFYPGDNYQFLIQNLPQEAGGNKLVLYPTPQETGALIQVWYIREIRRLTTSTTDANNVCELSECVNFVLQHCKWNIAKKRRIADVIQQEKAARDEQYTLMEQTFKEMVADGNNKVLMDVSSYYSQELDLNY